MAAIHHIRLNCSDLTRAEQFYSPILTSLGFETLDAHGEGSARRLRFSKDGLVLLISQAAEPGTSRPDAVGLHHLSFAVASREAVDDFYQRVLLRLAGVAIEDPPVECPEYRDGYYATFFFDPDGTKLEVTYTP